MYYRLTQQRLADWVLSGIDFLQREFEQEMPVRDELEQARQYWTGKKVAVKAR